MYEGTVMCEVLTLQDHINMRGTQFLAAASANADHTCHYMVVHQPTPRSIKTTPQALYTGFLNTIPQHSSSHIHTHFTNLAIQKLGPNTILGTPPTRNTPLRTCTTTCGPSTPQQASLCSSHCSGNLPKENR